MSQLRGIINKALVQKLAVSTNGLWHPVLQGRPQPNQVPTQRPVGEVVNEHINKFHPQVPQPSDVRRSNYSMLFPANVRDQVA
jgi:hypothetical protein